jgi:hypothetical protein
MEPAPSQNSYFTMSGCVSAPLRELFFGFSLNSLIAFSLNS